MSVTASRGVSYPLGRLGLSSLFCLTMDQMPVGSPASMLAAARPMGFPGSTLM